MAEIQIISEDCEEKHGKRGRTGPTGPTGPSGTSSATGATGPTGPLAGTGPTGPAGATGPSTSGGTELVPAASGITLNAANTNSNPNAWALGAVAGAANGVLYPLVVKEGVDITGISVTVDKQSDATNSLTLELVASDGISTYSLVGVFNVINSTNAPGVVVLSINSTATTQPGFQYALRIYQSNAAPSAVDFIGGATFTHT